MPSVTHDGRSFLIDGRRVWLVSGRVPYARLPRETWADRIHAAKNAGLNTIETPVFWSRHEPRPGKFDFTGDNDLRHFVDLVGKAGMYCFLGMGPYVGAEADMGGLPPWLRDNPEIKLRTNSGPFLEACSRFLTGVAEQIKGWQVTAPGTGGPIVLLQCEGGWTCGKDQLAQSYLGELTRYIREAGLNVPLINANNLWQSVEGQIDGWASDSPMLGTLRQLASVRPGAPRMVVDLPFVKPAVWGQDAPEPMHPSIALRRLAEVCAAGGQFNLTSFCGGTNFGFFGGRLADGPDAFVTTSASVGCLVDEAGRPTASYSVVRRLAHAVSHFGRVFANLDPLYQPIALEPASGPVSKGKAAKSSSPGVSVVHATGSQGGVVFIFGDDPLGSDPALREASLLLPDGSTLPVPVMSDGTAWCFFDINVHARARLDYANMSLMGAAGQALVFFGPAGSQAIISLNGSPIEATVPDADGAPVVLEHEGLTLIILPEAQADGVFFADDMVYLGVGGARPDGAPIMLPGAKTYTRVQGDGNVKRINADPPRSRRADKPALSAWTYAGCDDYLDGSSPRYARIAGPVGLAKLGSPFGYGWYRVAFADQKPRRADAVLPNAADRLHLFSDGKALGVMGFGPGAKRQATIPFHKGDQTLVILAENFGRFSEGTGVGEGKGLLGPGFEATPMRVAKPELESGTPLDVLAFRSPLWQISEGDTTSPDRITWTLPKGKKSTVLMNFDEPASPSLLVLNDTPIAYLDASGPTCVVIDAEQLSRGANSLQIAPIGHGEARAELKRYGAAVHFQAAEGSLFEGAEVAFAKWEPPAPTAYHAEKAASHAGVPGWWKSTFAADPADGPLFLTPAGMTKGQMFVNGRHLARYFVATGAGKAVPPQETYFIPHSWLKADAANEIVLFDEHGGNPGRCKLARA